MEKNEKPGKGEFIDNFDRGDGPLGNGWIDAYAAQPKWWDEFKIVNGIPVTPNPDRGLICQPDNSGSRAAFYQDFGPEYKENISASLIWCGNRPYEGTPLIHVNPDDDDFGLGAWFGGIISSILIGVVGRSPDKFRFWQVIPVDHIDTLQRRIELRSNGSEFSVWISKTDIRDDAMIQVGASQKVPEGLVGSSMHGAALDLNQTHNRPPNTPVLLPPWKLQRISPDMVGSSIYYPDGHQPAHTFPTS